MLMKDTKQIESLKLKWNSAPPLICSHSLVALYCRRISSPINNIFVPCSLCVFFSSIDFSSGFRLSGAERVPLAGANVSDSSRGCAPSSTHRRLHALPGWFIKRPLPELLNTSWQKKDSVSISKSSCICSKFFYKMNAFVLDQAFLDSQKRIPHLHS